MLNLGRAWMAVRQGVTTGWTTAINSYNKNNHVAELEFNFADYDARLARYWHNRRYADNTIYHAVNQYASAYKADESLYKHIRGLRNPIARLVKMEAAKVFGGVIDYENFTSGAIVISGADDNLLESIRRVLRWSNMDAIKSLYVREGATMGDIALKVVDDVDRGKVRLEVLDPRKVYDVQFDAVGNVKYIDIRYDRYNADTQKWYEYREVIDKEHFEIFEGKDRVDEWDNPYGFVPVEWTQHVKTSLGFGVPSFHESRHKIDNLNDLATLIHDNVRKVVNAKYAAKNVSASIGSDGKPTTITTTGDNRDNSPFLFVGDGEITPIVSPIDINGALAAASEQSREIENDLPQLALQSIRDKNSNLSGVAIKNMYGDAVDVLGELQSSYGLGLRSGIQMAISIGAFRRYDDFRGYNIDSYHNGALDFDIRPKELFSDSLTKKEQIELTNVAFESKAPELLLKEIGYDEDSIMDFRREQMRNQAIAVRTQPSPPALPDGNPSTDTPSDIVEQDTPETDSEVVAA